MKTSVRKKERRKENNDREKTTLKYDDTIVKGTNRVRDVTEYMYIYIYIYTHNTNKQHIFMIRDVRRDFPIIFDDD